MAEMVVRLVMADMTETQRVERLREVQEKLQEHFLYIEEKGITDSVIIRAKLAAIRSHVNLLEKEEAELLALGRQRHGVGFRKGEHRCRG